jgi:2-oxoglutarate dehydrogenase E1 component
MTSFEMNETSFLFGQNAAILQKLQTAFLENPQNVTPEWREFFSQFGDRLEDVVKESTFLNPQAKNKENLAPQHLSLPTSLDEIRCSLKALMLIRSYRVRGHLFASLDPLQLHTPLSHPELDPKAYGFTEEDLNREIFLDQVLGFEKATLKSIIQHLQTTYCGSIGVEFMHNQDPHQKFWIQEKLENPNSYKVVSSEKQKQILEMLVATEGFEKFLHTKYVGAKKFGLEGGDSFIPGLYEALITSVQHGVQDVVLGMAHRGRLNVLANILEKPLSTIFSEFKGGVSHPKDIEGSGDVKYHLGYSSDREILGQKCHLSLTPNPSHLESVDPVVLGKVRAKQQKRHDSKRSEVMGILIHGDAAFIGQGIVAETFGLSELSGYETGGTLHIVINNQIGFTTSPYSSRSSHYCSDIAKMVQAPIFHVNGDDPEAVIIACRLASAFRSTFQKDVVIDLVCYRRFGHNEADDPSFTQPLMYAAIQKHPSVLELYSQKLIEKGVVTQQELSTYHQNYQSHLDKAFENSTSDYVAEPDWLTGYWKKIEAHALHPKKLDNTLTKEFLQSLGIKLIEAIPKDFTVHPRLLRLLEGKREALIAGHSLDWATAESLAFATLLWNGHHIRLSGQDCGRGTFSQRHSVLVDHKNETKFIPLNNLKEDQAHYEVIDSPLSEFSVLGFEYGYSTTDPDALVMWEAQFGDFANGAQVIFDQYISATESKWLRMSGVVCLLPHGYEGQGPEHSSARLERYLQLCAENNMQVANCTTPANYFHILRRQVLQKSRKPLILMTPKSLLRHKKAVSSLEEMANGSSFLPVIQEKSVSIIAKKVKRLVLCSGKVFYDLWEKREEHQKSDVALVRVEQLYPFPEDALKQVLAAYEEAEVVWCQEEPENMGAWLFMDRRLEKVMQSSGMQGRRPLYVGRKEAASPATGFLKKHEQEQDELVRKALIL